tara:strand:- start:923 stop:1390 length:468 start_codon:yes stop_codon:yes gene_type:complete
MYMIILGIQMKAITKYVATLVYCLLYFFQTTKNPTRAKQIGNILSILYGPITAVAIIGLVINNFYHSKIQKRDGTSIWVRIGSDIFGHILPLWLIYTYGPTQTNVSLLLYLAIIAIFFISMKKYLLETYIGVPQFLITSIAPLICIVMFYLRFCA